MRITIAVVTLLAVVLSGYNGYMDEKAIFAERNIKELDYFGEWHEGYL